MLAGATLEGVQLIGIDELQVVGQSTFDNCQVDGTVRVVNGNATIRNGLELNGEWILNPNRSVNFVDTQTLTGTGELRTTGGGSVNVLTGPLTIDTGMLLWGSGLNINTTTVGLVNLGTIRADGAGQCTLQGTGWTNQGTLEAVNGGRLNLRGTGWMNTGTISGAVGTILSLGGTGWQQQGTVNAPGGTLDLTGTYTLSGLGTYNISGGTVNVGGTMQGGVLDSDAQGASWLLAEPHWKECS